uniref:Uncharacterized protein n=1 Tax=Ciona savignyi TaxID=51511 RepID=H2YIW9_CIOSA
MLSVWTCSYLLTKTIISLGHLDCGFLLNVFRFFSRGKIIKVN